MVRPPVIAVVALAALACGEGLGPNVDYVFNRGRWEQRGPASYTYEFHRGCFCGGDAIQPVRITVTNGVVTSVVRVEDGQPVPPDQITLYFRITIDSLFDILGEALEDADAVTVQYHPFWGYPTTAAIDYIRSAIDDEVNYSAELNVHFLAP